MSFINIATTIYKIVVTGYEIVTTSISYYRLIKKIIRKRKKRSNSNV